MQGHFDDSVDRIEEEEDCYDVGIDEDKSEDVAAEWKVSGE